MRLRRINAFRKRLHGCILSCHALAAHRVESADDALAVAIELSSPVAVKPADGIKGRGVTVAVRLHPTVTRAKCIGWKRRAMPAPRSLHAVEAIMLGASPIALARLVMEHTGYVLLAGASAQRVADDHLLCPRLPAHVGAGACSFKGPLVLWPSIARAY